MVFEFYGFRILKFVSLMIPLILPAMLRHFTRP